MNSLIYSAVLWVTFFFFISNAQSLFNDNLTTVGSENEMQYANISASVSVGFPMLILLNEAGLDVHKLMSDCNGSESLRNQTMEELSALNSTFILEALELNDTGAVLERLSDLIDGSPFLQGYATSKAVVAKISTFSHLLNRFGVDYNHLIDVARQNQEIGKQILKELSPFNQTVIKDALQTDKRGLLMSTLIRSYVEKSALLMSYRQPQRGSASAALTVSTILLFLLSFTSLVNNVYACPLVFVTINL